MKNDTMRDKQAAPDRVLAIHDLSGYSHTSLMAVLPIMSRMGISVCALPTAILSTNTELAGFKLVDMTKHLLSFLEHWSRLKLEFDAIYSGFLSSEHQVEIVIKAIEIFKYSCKVIVIDPVMADDGMLYSCFDFRIVTAMRQLIRFADVITPNLTEAALLLDEPYDERLSISKAKLWCKKLSAMGPEQVVITGIPVGKNSSRISVVSYSRSSDSFSVNSGKYHPVKYPGTGDIFTSVLTGYLLKGDNPAQAIKKAMRFINKSIQQTSRFSMPIEEGLCLERSLQYLKA